MRHGAVGEHKLSTLQLGPTQRETEHFAQLLNQMHGQRAPHILGQIVEIRFVLLGENDGRDAGPDRPQDLLLHAADREYPAAQRDFTRHRQIMAHRLP